MEYVVLLDDAGRSIGIELKSTVHTTATPLHLAFSAYVFDRKGNLLITRRALEKATWPGVWTNSCCGHPAPNESLEDAVRRRLNQELGIDVDDVSLALPFFRYRAVMATGVVENEICPVFRVIYDGPQSLPDPEEVESAEWVDWREFSDSVLSGDREVSPWCREQVQQLRQLGLDPRQWPTADAAALPPAAREGMGRRLPR
ncbi:isopentenyl-diphosphate Delta-isomerase [Rhodococcus sp. NPDC056743]|uniref:isopentenyl-diphosphate Delta-isomerase n=1 Tax=Rhodococcus sp. NPDC056743 TaxID=3345934 RepID=UPI00366ACA7D